jgi:hypothetical protein
MKKNANHWMIEYGILGQIGCLLFTNGVNLAMQSKLGYNANKHQF